jgi:hypothetical protein
MLVKPLEIAEFVTWLQEDTGFCFARYGDGTFLGMQGIEGKNCDGALVRFDQTSALEASIRDTTITHGIGDLAISVGKAHKWLAKKEINIDWYDCNVMHTASITGKLYPFIQFLRTRRIILLGPKHLGQLRKLSLQAFIPVHPTEAFYEVPRLYKTACRTIQQTKANTVLISAGTAAPVLVSRLHLAFPSINIIDTGSLWDPYVGKLSRKVFRDLGYAGIRKLTIKNFM